MPRPPESCDTGSEAQAETTAASAPTPQDRQGWDAAGLENIQDHGPTYQDQTDLQLDNSFKGLLTPKKPAIEAPFRMVDFQEQDSEERFPFNPWFISDSPFFYGMFDDAGHLRQLEEFLRNPHTALGAASLVPGPPGAVASAADGVLYAYEGDRGSAGLSFVAAGAGIFFDAGGAKLAAKALKKGTDALREAGGAAHAAADLDKAATAGKDAATSAESAGKSAAKAADTSVADKAAEDAAKSTVTDVDRAVSVPTKTSGETQRTSNLAKEATDGKAVLPGAASPVLTPGTALTASAHGAFEVSEGGADRGIYFFNEEISRLLNRDGATLGPPGKSQFFMPLGDSSLVTDAASAYRYSGGATSLADAYNTGGHVYGIEFPLDGLVPRLPTEADANFFPHFLPGGRTALRLPEDGGYLVNPTREFVVPGGRAMPSGSVLFRLAPDGTRIPLRSW